MPKLLIADRQEILLVGLRTILEEVEDWEVVAEATDGREVINLALMHKPDVVITEYFLPSIQAIGIIRELKRRLPETETLVLGTDSGQDFIVQTFLAGGKGYVIKNQTNEVIIAAVKHLLKHKPFFNGDTSKFFLDSYIKNPNRGLLSARERIILQMVVEGSTSKQIAGELGISIKTVECHRGHLMTKTGAGSIAQLVRYAIRNKLVDLYLISATVLPYGILRTGEHLLGICLN